MKSIIGRNNKTIYLKSEVKQHYYAKKIKDSITNYLDRINFYINSLKKQNSNFIMFIIPDKCVVCNNTLPYIYNKNNLFRLANEIIKNNTNIIDLYDTSSLLSKDFYITDSHLNDTGVLKICKSLMKNFIDCDEIIDKIDSNLKVDFINKFSGDLTNPINLHNQDLITELELYEDIKNITNICYSDYIDKIKDIDIKYRFCFHRASKYVYNKNAIIKKTVLIYSSSTVSNKLFEFLSFYFENTFFYWNHLHINNDLIKAIKPDILLDIRIERFLCINEILYENIINYDSVYDIDFIILTYNEIYSILVNMDTYTFENIIKNIKNIDEIKNNLKIWSCILHEYHHLIKTYDNININEILNLNEDLLIFYDSKIEKEISDLTLLNYLNNNKDRKCKYENIAVQNINR